MYSTLNEIARISTETIISIENYLSRDDSKHKPKSSSQTGSDDEAPNAEAKMDIDSDHSTVMDESDADGVHKRWLRKTLIGLSPNLDVMAVASVQKFVVLERSKRMVNGVNLMELVARVEVTTDSQAYVSSLVVFGVRPPSSTSSSQSLTADWTCICIGLNTGEVMFYTEKGILIFHEKFAHCQIESLKLGPSTLPGNQELIALTAAAKFIVIEGLSLYTTLRTARAQIARQDRSLDEICGNLQLNAHQLQLDNLHNVGDIQMVGLARPDTFDQYMNAGRAGRDEVITLNQLPIYAHLMCTSTIRRHKEKKDRNDSEFVCFLWHNTQSSAGTFTDAIFSLTSQITNNIPSFGFRSFTGLGTSRKDRLPKKMIIEARTSWVPKKSSLIDNKRRVERTFVAPTSAPCSLAALSDNLGRITLINTHTRQILRIWKGYRQARVAWYEASTNLLAENGNGVRKALFLIIFAPKRGLLEVWSMQNGPRVSAFRVDEHSRLLSAPTLHNGVLLGGAEPRDSTYQETNRAGAIFLTPDGSLCSLDVPFHLSALSTSSTAIYDESLIKEFNIHNFTKSSTEGNIIDVDKLLEFVRRIKTNAAKQRFLETLIIFSSDTRNKDERQEIFIPIESLNELLTRLIEQESSGDLQGSSVSPYLLALHTALDLYATLDQNFSKTQNENEQSEVVPLKNINCNRDDPLISKALEAFELVSSHSRNDVFDVSTNIIHCRLTLQTFLNYFNLNLNHPLDGEYHLEFEFDDASKISVSSRATLGCTIFLPFLLNPTLDFKSFLERLFSKVRLRRDFLVAMLVAFWLEPQWNIRPEYYSEQLFDLIYYIFDNSNRLTDIEWVEFVKESFKFIEQMVVSSANVPAALILAIQMGELCQRLINLSNERKSKKEIIQQNEITLANDDEENHFIIFHKIDLELLNELRTEIPKFWAYLSLHLAALHLLQFLFQQTIQNEQQNWHFSIANAARMGPNYYRETIGLWASQIDHPSSVGHCILNAFSANENSDTGKFCFEPLVADTLKLLAKIFPQSFRLELVLCDSAWECASAWFKDESRRIVKLKRSVELIELLYTVPKLQNGLALLIWNTFLCETFKKLFYLIEEELGSEGLGITDYHGRYPLAGKDRILRRDILVTEKDLPKYVNCVRRLLEVLVESSCHLGGRQDVAYGPLTGTLHLEDSYLSDFFAYKRLKQHLSLTDRSTDRIVTTGSLVLLVDSQKATNYHLALHMVHLASVLEIQVSVISGNCAKPSSLFDANGKRAFFNPLHTHPLLPMARVDDRTKVRRQRFVEQYMEVLGKEEGGQEEVEHPNSELISHSTTIRRVLDRLIKDWTLDVTTMQVREITWLYLCGEDEKAEAKCDQIHGNRQKLALEIIPIIAGRIKQLNEETQGTLCDKAIQASMASESTLSFVKKTTDEHLPNFGNVNSKKLRRMIRIAKASLIERQSNKGQLTKERNEGQTMEFSKCQKLLHEFDEISNVADWLENQKPCEHKVIL